MMFPNISSLSYISVLIFRVASEIDTEQMCSFYQIIVGPKGYLMSPICAVWILSLLLHLSGKQSPALDYWRMLEIVSGTVWESAAWGCVKKIMEEIYCVLRSYGKIQWCSGLPGLCVLIILCLIYWINCNLAEFFQCSRKCTRIVN